MLPAPTLRKKKMGFQGGDSSQPDECSEAPLGFLVLREELKSQAVDRKRGGS